MRFVALASGLADKAVSLLYERIVRAPPSEVWMDRCRRQILDTFAALEAELVKRGSPFWLGAAPSHGDIAFACALRFTREAHAGLFDPRRHPALEALAGRCEALPELREIYQPLTF
jgi:glutathione S-transferase